MARPKKQRIVKITDLGPEPISVRSTSQLLRAYQWYNYEYTQKDGLKFVAAYATSNLPKAQALAIKALPIEAISHVYVAVSYVDEWTGSARHFARVFRCDAGRASGDRGVTF